MDSPSDLVAWVFDNIQKLLFPEDWIALDLAISKTELLTLFFVERSGEVTMTRLAEFLASPLSTATGIVDRLVRAGLLSRDRAEEDRRIVVLHLAEKGKATISGLKTTLSDYLGRIRSALSPEEEQTALSLAMKVIKTLQSSAAPVRPAGDEELQRIAIE